MYTKPVTIVETNSQSVPLQSVQRKQKKGDKKTNNIPVLSQYIFIIVTWEE